MNQKIWLFFLYFFFSGSLYVKAIVFDANAYDPARHQRFYSGADKNFIGDDTSAFPGALHALDFSGVGQQVGTPFNVVMISEHWFLSGLHNQTSVPSNFEQDVSFWIGTDPTPVFTTNTLAGVGGIFPDSDLWLGKLASAPPLSVKRYPVMKVPTGVHTTVEGQVEYAFDWTSYLNSELIV